MDRTLDFSAAAKRRTIGLAAGLSLGLLLLYQTGCVSALAGVMWVVKGNEVAAEFDGLKGKRVVVVCRPVVELQYSTGSVHTEIAQKLGYMLQHHLKKIEIVDPQKVAEWTDEHDWNDFKEIGEALDAEMVVGIDLEHFSIYQGQTLYQGKAQLAVEVRDIEDHGKVAFQKHLPQVIFPPNTGVPTSEKPEDEFRRQFVTVLADEIGRYFYPHDATADFARDSDSLH